MFVFSQRELSVGFPFFVQGSW